MADKADLTSDEIKLIAALRGARKSDRKLCQGLGMTKGRVGLLMASLRTKLNVDIGRETLRDAVRRLGL